MTERIQRALVPTMQLGMQACWFYAWLALIAVKTDVPGTVAPTIILFLGAAALARWALMRSPLRQVTRLGIYWVAWFLLAAIAGKLLLFPSMPWGQVDWLFALPRGLVRVVFETRPAELLLLLGSGGAWYLGGQSISRGPTYETILGQFQFGLVMLLGAFLAAQGLSISTGHPLLLAITFFTLALTGIAITRSRQEQARAPGAANRQFAGSLVTLLVAVTALGLLASVIVTPGLIEVILNAVGFALHAVGSAIVYVLSLLPQPDLTPPEGDAQPPATGDDSGLLEFYRTFPWPAVLKRVIFIVWVVVIMGMFLLALWRIFSTILGWLKRRSNMNGVEVESLSSGFLADLLAFMLWFERAGHALAARFRKFARSRFGPSGKPTWSSIYLNFARWAGKKLAPREPSQSAHEYQEALSRLLPAASRDLALITDTYARARYGRYEPDNEALREMQSAVLRIRTAPRRPKNRVVITLTEGAQ